MKGDLDGDVYEKIENFLSQKSGLPFVLPDDVKNLARSDASEIRIRYRKASSKEDRFVKQNETWLEVFD